MNSKVLDNKKTKKLDDNTEYLDLYSSNLSFSPTDMRIIDSFYVGDDMAMRPDLISIAAYGTDTYWDVLLKFNGISNPFSIAPHQLIYVPELEWLSNQVKPYDANNIIDRIRSQYIDPTKSGEEHNKKKDNEILSKYKLYNQLKDDFDGLPPNLNSITDGEAIFLNDDTILLGSDVS